MAFQVMHICALKNIPVKYFITKLNFEDIKEAKKLKIVLQKVANYLLTKC